LIGIGAGRLLGGLAKAKQPATNVYCAKAKRQQQMFTVRKRSDSNKCLLCESEATATRPPAGTENQLKESFLNKI